MINFLILLFLITLTGNASAAPVWQTQVLRHHATLDELSFTGVFHFVNKGDTTVEITRIQSGCGCTVAEPDQWRYEPGENGQIQAQFVYGDRTGTHRMQVVVHMRSETQDLPPSILEMEVGIPQLVELDKRLLLWQSTAGPTPQRLNLRTNADAGVELSKAVAEDPTFSVQVIPTKDQPGEHTIEVTPSSLENAASTSRLQLYIKVPGRDQHTLVSVFLMVR